MENPILWLQYFVFNKDGTKILEASVIPCSDEQELRDTANLMVLNFNTNPDFKNTQLTLSCGSEILFSSNSVER